MVSSQTTGSNGSHVLAMHELMIHVEKIFVHEGVVTGNLTVEPTRLVVLVLRRAESRWHATLCQRCIARKNKNQAIDFPRRIASNARGESFRAKVRDIDAFAGAVINPAVIMAFQVIAADHPQMQ